MKKFPFLSQNQAFILLRTSLGIVFFLHAIFRITNGTITRFGGFLDSKGFPFGVIWVYGITAFELVGSVILALGYFTKWLSATFIVILLVGILIIHLGQGWFVGEHGTGGVEYSFILIVAFLVLASQEKKPL
jgi:putative oxidoreductase